MVVFISAETLFSRFDFSYNNVLLIDCNQFEILRLQSREIATVPRGCLNSFSVSVHCSARTLCCNVEWLSKTCNEAIRR